MKLSDFRKKGDEYTSKASDITRQLIFAGIAIIWLFKTEKDGRQTLDNFLIFPLLFLCTALMYDLFQYVVGGEIWKSYYQEQEKKAIQKHSQSPLAELDPEIKAPKKLNRPIYWLYRLKIAFLIIAYILIVVYLLKEINFN